MHALIDADIMCYEMGSAVDRDGIPIDWPLVRSRVDMKINHILWMTEATSWSGYLTAQNKTNFRFEVATIKGYKAHRAKKDKPYWYQDVYDYIAGMNNITVVEGQEADDAMSIYQWRNLTSVLETYGPEHITENTDTVICTRDKDLLMVPGWHYAWPSYSQEEREPFWISPIEGLRNFYKQLLTGDAADNIPGLYGIGPSSNFLRKMDTVETELEMFAYVQELYEKYYGSYWKFFLLENGRLLWMRRYDGEMWEFPRGWQDAIGKKDNKE